jgi:SAM-dependent methyltransferase
MDDYDRLFYQSLCLPRTHPDHLAALGRLMGLNAAEPDGCRVLELGCAAGGNLIPMAGRLPRARFVGVDLSAAQIAAGQCLVDSLGLDNIDLRTADIAMLNEGIGEFDYVIAHGVYSWVPDAVRAALLRLARQVLAPDGLCYISFNTLPGWRMRGMLRDILCDACRGVSEPAARLAAAQAALARLERALPELPGLGAEYLRAEIAALRGLHPSYLYFEYLAEHNRAFLFRDFLADVQAQGLRYLCDADLQRQFPASLGDAVDDALADLTDGADVEQWLDFVGTRNFRESLLMRDDARCEEQLSLERFAGLCFSADLQAPPRLDLRDTAAATFRRPDGESVDVLHPLTKALLLELAGRYPDALSLPHLLPAARRRLQAAGAGHTDDVDALLAEMFGLFARGNLRARMQPRRSVATIATRPAATALARAQVASGQDQVATIDHGNLGVDALAVRLIGYLDGTRTVPELAAQLQADLDDGTLRPTADQSARPASGSPQALERVCRELLALFRRYGVLEQSAES